MGKLTNIFEDAVDRLKVDRPKQYIFTLEVVLEEESLLESELDDACELIRRIGSIEVADVQELALDDGRCL